MNDTKHIMYILENVEGNSYSNLIQNFNGKVSQLKSAYNYLKQNKIISYEDKFSVNNSIKSLVLTKNKYVKVFANGNRAVKIEEEFIVISKELKNLEFGSVYLSGNKNYNPKARVNSINVYRLYNQKMEKIPISLELIKDREKDNLKFIAEPKPAIQRGDFVKFSYYLWLDNYYAKNREEAIEKYDEEYIGEGIMMYYKALKFNISVRFPVNYKYIDAGKYYYHGDLEHFSLSNLMVYEKFEANLKKLVYTIKNPDQGVYFIRWIPGN